MLQVHQVFALPQLWNQPLLQGALVPFTEEWCLETKIWVVSVLIATGDSLLLGLFSVQSLEMYYPLIHTSVFILVSIFLNFSSY